MLRVLWLDPAAFDVSVRNGEAVIRGRVERRSTAEIIEETVRMVPGIVALDIRLPWAIDDRDIRPAEREPIFPFGAR